MKLQQYPLDQVDSFLTYALPFMHCHPYLNNQAIALTHSLRSKGMQHSQAILALVMGPALGYPGPVDSKQDLTTTLSGNSKVDLSSFMSVNSKQDLGNTVKAEQDDALAVCGCLIAVGHYPLIICHPVSVTSAAVIADFIHSADKESFVQMAGVQSDMELVQRALDKRGLQSSMSLTGGSLAKQSGWTTEMDQVLYRLDEDAPSPVMPWGHRLRVAGQSDLPLITRWTQLFKEEVFTSQSLTQEQIYADCCNRIEAGHVLLYEVPAAQVPELGTADVVQPGGGKMQMRPVSMLGFARVTDPLCRITSVWTPGGLRRRGYASHVLAEGCRHLKARGLYDVVLFADKAYQASNQLYQKAGFANIGSFTLLGRK